MSTRTLDIKINQSIISILGRKLYSNQYGMVVLRELLQNSIDANADIINVSFVDNILTVNDNGDGIEKIEGLLDTIGASIKDTQSDSIGGYGLAKLAIFGCKNWKFLSKSGSFSSGFKYDNEDTYTSGTIVTCEFTEGDIQSNYETRVKDYLKSINREIQFSYNGELLEKYTYTRRAITEVQSEIFADTPRNGQIAIRVNGLPTFYRNQSNLDKTIYLDFYTSLTPYDEGYPLTSNRDAFIYGTPEYDDLEMRIKAIDIKLQTDKKLSELVSKDSNPVITWRGKKYQSWGDVSLDDYENSSMEISSYKRYIEQIAALFGYSYEIQNYGVGLSDGSEELGAFSRDNKMFYLAKQVTGKGMVLSIAMHEFVHFLGYQFHDQMFSAKLGEINGVVINAIFRGEFRK